ncbi:MAG: hypothetical protein ACRC5C_15390 [Bacilli bacterium]
MSVQLFFDTLHVGVVHGLSAVNIGENRSYYRHVRQKRNVAIGKCIGSRNIVTHQIIRVSDSDVWDSEFVKNGTERFMHRLYPWSRT